MIEATGNLWTYPADFPVITTNGSVRRDGCAVMGRGCAREAADRWPKLPVMLGADLRHGSGNRVRLYSDKTLGADRGLFVFPVKHRWMEPASLDLIAESVVQFERQLLTSCTYVMPRPGCGNGRLSWNVVRPLLVCLPDNVVVITFGECSL